MKREEIVPVELTFINTAKRVFLDKEMLSESAHNKGRSEGQPEESPNEGSRFFKYLDIRYLNKCRDFTILKAYGWNDFVIISKNPITLRNDKFNLNEQGGNSIYASISESSVLGWISRKICNAQNNDVKNSDKTSEKCGNYYIDCISSVESYLPPLCNSIKNRENKDSINLYVLSFISLDRGVNMQKQTEESEELDCIEGGMVIHCVGIWDVITIVKISKSENPIENIEKFKKEFLYSELIRRSSSVILVSLNNEEIDLIRQGLKDITDRDKVNYFKSTIEDVLCS